jgi:hypothetical protein
LQYQGHGQQVHIQGNRKSAFCAPFAILVWGINSIALSWNGGGFFGEFVPDMPWSFQKLCYLVLQIVIQVLYAWWNFTTLFSPVSFLPTPLEVD